MRWNLAEAKNKLSEVFRCADKAGYQIITRKGREYFLLTKEKYQKLSGQSKSLVDFLIEDSPSEELDLSARPKSSMRDVQL